VSAGLFLETSRNFFHLGEKKYESFNYGELVDMKINALDLLDRPMSYRIDPAAYKILSKK